MARHRKSKDDRGRIEQTATLDGQTFSLEPSSARRNGALLTGALLLVLTLVWQLALSGNNAPYWMFGMIGIWAGVPLRYELTVAHSGLRIGVARSWMGRLSKLLERDPVSPALRRRYGNTHGDVIIPWEAITGVASKSTGRHKLALLVALGDERLELVCSVRHSHRGRFLDLVDALRNHAMDTTPAQVPVELQALRSARVLAPETAR